MAMAIHTHAPAATGTGSISTETRELQQKAHSLIPGGAHTYAKGDDQYPLCAPPFLDRGSGCRVWDRDGNEYIEYGMGLRAVTLGHAFPEVVTAVERQLARGTNFTRPASLEVETAETLLSLVPGAEMVKFCKDGSTATSAAIRLARAHTGRDMIALCGDHPFFSYDDWFIGTTPMSAGIPHDTQETSIEFRYNDVRSLENLFEAYPDRIACVILEPEREIPPQGDFLHEVQRLCRTNGALFILDEMITGFRWNLGGAQTLYDLQPDLSAFGKALANGFAVSALVGSRAVMSPGGLDHHGDRVFLLSTTHGAEAHSLAAAKATMDVYRERGVVEVLRRRGEQLQEGISSHISDLGLEKHFAVRGHPANLVYATCDETGAPSQAFRTLFLQETIRRGLIAPSLVVSFSHGSEEIDHTAAVIGEALEVYRRALHDGVEAYLEGPPVKPVFRRRA